MLATVTVHSSDLGCARPWHPGTLGTGSHGFFSADLKHLESLKKALAASVEERG